VIGTPSIGSELFLWERLSATSIAAENPLPQPFGLKQRQVSMEAGYGALRHPIGNQALPLWEWLPATTMSRQDAAPTEKFKPAQKLRSGKVRSFA
jgi:hypothetical protein